MKSFLLSPLLLIATFLSCNNQKPQGSSTCFKGRLEIAGICSNYTIKLLEGSVDTSKINAAWTDENTGKAYTNVFALGSPCSFPVSIKAGDEFYFVLNNTEEKCAVCMAYYPKPPRALSIKVLDKPCSQ